MVGFGGSFSTDLAGEVLNAPVVNLGLDKNAGAAALGAEFRAMAPAVFELVGAKAGSGTISAAFGLGLERLAAALANMGRHGALQSQRAP